MEEWRDIPGYEGLYQASTHGRIKTVAGKTTSNKRYKTRVWKERIMKPKVEYAGRQDYRICLWKDGKPKDFLVARLVALTWVDGYSDGLTVNHIDGDFQNNHYSNLEWISRAENIRKGYETGLYSSIQKPVVLKSAEQAMHFDSMSAASRFLGRSEGYVSNCVKKNRSPSDASGNKYILEITVEN
jgi:hypothetical protein